MNLLELPVCSQNVLFIYQNPTRKMSSRHRKDSTTFGRERFDLGHRNDSNLSDEKDMIWEQNWFDHFGEKKIDLDTERNRPDLDEKAVIYRNKRTLKNLRETSLQRNYFSKLEIFTAFECLYKHVRLYLIFENSFWSSSFLPKQDNETTKTEWGYWV